MKLPHYVISHRRPIVFALLGIIQCLVVSSAVAESFSGGQVFGDWVVSCDSQDKAKIECVMSQTVVVGEPSQRLMQVDLRYSQALDKTSMEFGLPLGVALSFSPQLFVDGKMQQTIFIDLCVANGCYSTFDPEPGLLDKFLLMQAGYIYLQGGSGKMLSLPISGKGTQAAYDAMQFIARSLADES